MHRWLTLILCFSLVACGEQQETPSPKPATIEALMLTPLPDKKLAVSFRVLDAEGKAMRVHSIGYNVLGCSVGPVLRDDNYDPSKNELATFEADLQFCGRPPAHYKVKLELRVGLGPDKIHASAEVEAKVAYERTAPRSLAELETELGRLATARMASTEPPFATPNPENVLFELVIDRIVEMEAPAVPKLLPVWKSDREHVRARAAAAAIGALEPALLVKDTITLLEQYDEAFAVDPSARMSPTARAGAAGVYAVGRFEPGAAADVYFRALSSPDAQLSGMAATWIKRRLPRDVAIDGLFRYMAAKQSYNQREIDIYVAVIEQFGAEASPTVAKNLERLLAAAGKPDKVFWAHKVVGLTALEKVGQSPVVATIEKFKADKGMYVSANQPLDAFGKPEGPVERRHIAFTTLAGNALAAIAKR
jgi:hypothetical protein